jgi:hypothetical protein
LTHDQQRLLFSNPRLRADFQRLKRDIELAETGDASEDESAGVSIVRFPLAAAAASAGENEIDEREFGGIELRSARSGDQMLIQVANYDPRNPPNRLQVQGARGETSRVVLPPPPLSGEPILLVKNLQRETDAQFVSRLRDRNFSIALFRARGFARGQEEFHTRDDAQVSIAIAFDDPGLAPKALLLEGMDGGLSRIELPMPRDARIEMTVELRDDDRMRLLDPSTRGAYLAG